MVLVNHNSADHLGGAERSMLAVVDRWTAQNPQISPVVVSPGPAPAMAAELERRGWRHLPLAFEGWAVFDASGGRGQERLRERAAAAATRSIIALLRETDAALVVTNTLVHPWGAIAAAAVGAPHVWFVREFGHADQGFLWPGGRDEALRELGELSHTVVANSLAVRAELAGAVPEEKLRVSYPPVDLAEVQEQGLLPLPEGTAPYPDPRALRVAVLGRVTRSKGQWRVVEALGLLRREGVRAQACFIGQLLDPGAEAGLRRRAAELGVADSIAFAGEQPNPFPWVAAAEVAVVPSQREAFGRSTLECLALGTPVIATRDGAGAELVAEGAGALFDAEDIAGLAAALRRYADDRGLAGLQASAARRRAAELMSGGYGLDTALLVLDDALGAEPAVLPAAWRSWVEALDRIADGGAPVLWRLQAGASRVATLVGKALRDPRKALRRLGSR